MRPPAPSSDLATRLQAAIGDAYRVEKELGGGGMSRVFLADEVRLGRKVVIKVLPPEMGAGVNVERFEREIQLAARLQHPHVVPLLTAGADGDLLYYMMPFIQGESLRAKLAREGELPVSEAVHILKEVADALAYAHAEGVVHRDIKPDNVLLSGRHAVVTDFGVAKAVSASTGQSSLTSLGVALGTPAYMSPEQAAANPNVDHRADIYALGALAYEMVCGRPPFTGANPQSVLAAHVTQQPDPPSQVRSTIPPALNELILRCLAKLPADRPQRADELIPHLDALLTPTGGTTPTGTQPVLTPTTEAAIRRSHPARVAAVFAVVGAVVLALVYGIMLALGLPTWVFVGAAALLAVGLPIMLVTAYHERHRVRSRTTGMVTVTPVGIRRWFTWRRALSGGGLAFAGLLLVTSAFMASRVLGIGPGATLVSAGVLDARSEILLADFQNRTTDSTLGPSVTDAFRVDLAQSPIVQLAEQGRVRGALRRMERDPTTGVDDALAREIAEREGIPAIVVGEIGPVGRGFVLSTRILSTQTGKVLAAVRETASDDGDIIAAIDRLSGKLRERIGESLKTIRANEPLERVTTASMPALRKYSQALRAEQKGDIDLAVSLLEEATTLDTAFAMGYRKLAVIFSNTGGNHAREMAATRSAYQHRDRLPEVERYLTQARYYDAVEGDPQKEMAAYRAVLEIEPDELTSLNNLAVELNARRQWAAAESLVQRAAQSYDEWVVYANLTWSRIGQGRFDDAQATLERFANIVGEDNAYVLRMRGNQAVAHEQFAAAVPYFERLNAPTRDLSFRGNALDGLRSVKASQGRLGEAEAFGRQYMEVEAERGAVANAVRGAAWLATVEARLRSHPAAARTMLEQATRQFHVAGMDAADRPYAELIEAYADAGDLARAKALRAEWERDVDAGERRASRQEGAVAGAIALGERRYDDAVAGFREWYDAGDMLCQFCGLYRMAEAYDLAGNADSALALYQRATAATGFKALESPADLVPAYRRLGELYEQHGDRQRAVAAYQRFVELWANADPELEPLVEDVRGRIARLVKEGR